MESSNLFSHPVDSTDYVYEMANGPVRQLIFSGRTDSEPSESASL